MRLLHACTFALFAATAGSTFAQDTATVQSALTLLGYDPGPIDGAWGSKTRIALEAFYENVGGRFSGQLGSGDYNALLLELLPLLPLLPSDSAHQLQYSDYFMPAQLVWFPAEYPFSDGADQPALDSHRFTVLHPHVHDFNGDGCDDIMTQFMDSNAHPRIIYGRPDDAENTDFVADLADHIPKSVAIRNTAVRDVNGDGKPDFVGFTAPHRLERGLYAPLWEPDVVVLQGGEAFATGYETYAHGGLIADVNGDGIVDILPIQEQSRDARHALLGDGNGGFGERFRFRALANDFIFSARAADFNGDGVDDFVFITSRDYIREKQVPPSRASENGTIAIALGEPGKSINELQFVRLGAHWMDHVSWTLFRLQGAAADSGYASADYWTYSAPSNVDLIDFDDDGDLDILVGYFVSANSSWRTSGFQLFRNDNGQFSDVTAEVAPLQPANRAAASRTTDALIGASMIDLNGDGDRDLLLSIQTPDTMHHSAFRAAVYLNVDGRFEPVANGSDALQSSSFMSAGDFNCDGVADVAGVGPRNQTQNAMRIILGKSAS